MQDYHDFIDEVLVDGQTIEKRVAELGAQISHDYAGEELLVVCLLRGENHLYGRPDPYHDHLAYVGLHVALLLRGGPLCHQRQCAR